MERNRTKLILASGSPRRKELLAASFINFEVIVSDIEENSNSETPSEIVMDLAQQKAQAVASQLKDSNSLVLGSDTIVVYKNEILGKPKNKQDARKTLMKLSGNTHEVFTGVCFILNNQIHIFYEKTEVRFNNITNDLLDLYLETGDSLDKAGAYGIQGAGLSFIAEIKGSYSNVVGLPIDKVIDHLKQFLGAKDDNHGQWRSRFV